jgi:hypothetical protein
MPHPGAKGAEEARTSLRLPHGRAADIERDLGTLGGAFGGAFRHAFRLTYLRLRQAWRQNAGKNCGRERTEPCAATPGEAAAKGITSAAVG